MASPEAAEPMRCCPFEIDPACLTAGECMRRAIMRGRRRPSARCHSYKNVECRFAPTKSALACRSYLLYIVTDMASSTCRRGHSASSKQLVLIALLRLGNGAFGAAIHREIVVARRAARSAPGAVYVTLDRLETKRMVCSYVGTPSRAARRPPPQALPARHRRPARPAARLPDLPGDDRRACSRSSTRWP